MTKNARRTTLLLIALLIAGIILLPRFQQKHRGAPEPPAQTSPMKGGKALNVNAEIVRVQTMSDRNITTGNIIPSEEVDLSFETSGKVVAIYFNEGEFVNKGKLLAKINDLPLQAQLKKLEAQEPLAKERVYRQQTLLEKNAVSQEAYEAVRTEYDKLMADIELVKANIAQTELHAPFDGIVGLRELSEGAYATPSTKVAKISHISTLKIDFSIPESYASEVGKGTPIVFRLEDSSGKMQEYQATVYAVESKINTETRTLQVRAIYQNTNRKLIPGRFVSVEITRREIPDALSVPSEAIIPELGRNLVYLYRNGKAAAVEIETGIRTESRVQALSGIQPGDTLIVTGVMQLRDGLPIVIDRLN